MTSHIRSINTAARAIRYAGAAVPPEVAQLAQLARTKLDAFITI